MKGEDSERMFGFVTETWNPVVGCNHICVYCWARKMAETRLKHIDRYKDGFKPKLVESEFRRKFKPGSVVFVCDMGDLFASCVPDPWIHKVLGHVEKFPETTFLLLTKNPKRYHEFSIPSNAIAGATIETNCYLEAGITRAPDPEERYVAMRSLLHRRKFISIEPIMDFDLNVFTGWILDINPEFIAVGYDNYRNRLPEPPLEKTMKLIEGLEALGIKVWKKTLRESWTRTSRA